MPKQRYLQTGAEPFIEPTHDIYERWMRTGQNTGNLFIGYATQLELNTIKSPMTWKPLDDEEIDQIRDNYDVIVVAASNFINPYSNFGVLANNIKRLNMPVITLGIGAQADNTKLKQIDLQDGTRELIHALSEHCFTIGVRGEYTAEVLHELGIRNTEIIGCPTYYVNKNPKYKINATPYKKFNDLRISYNFTNLHKEVDRKIASLAFQTKSDVIGQMEYIEDYWKNDQTYKMESLDDAEEIVKNDWHERKHLYLSFIQDFEKYKTYLKEHFYMFYNIPDWISQLKDYDYVCGTRFHGCMLAIQNHIPAILITHDSRTSELASYCNIPCITQENFLKFNSFEKILDKGYIDYDKFNREYENKFYKYIEFLRKNGIKDVDNLFELVK